MSTVWSVLATTALFSACFALLASGYVFVGILRATIPLLTETRQQVQDLGDVAANAIGRASETMDLVQLRVSQTMGQATLAGQEASRSSLGVGGALAGLYVAARFLHTFRSQIRSHKPRGRGRRRK